jgi:hypothetical protein
MARLAGGVGIAAVLIVGLALQMQLLVLRDIGAPIRIQEKPSITPEAERISIEIWPTGEVWVEGRWLGVWVQDGRKNRWVGESVSTEVARLLALAPEIRIEIDYDDGVPPDLVWRVVDQVGLEHLMETYPLPPLPRLPASPDVVAWSLLRSPSSVSHIS